MINDFISLFFPNYCLACRQALIKGEKYICLTCDHQLPKTDVHRDSDNFVAGKFYGKLPIHQAVAYYTFHQKGKVQQLLHQIKYKNKPELAEYLGKRYGHLLAETGLLNDYNLIIPIPLHRQKLRRRGYNQSECFAQGLNDALGLVLDTDSLIRVLATETQTRKSRLERWHNVENIFVVHDKEKIKGKKIILVDDVITTGSTLESAAKMLLSTGATSVSIAALAAAK